MSNFIKKKSLKLTFKINENNDDLFLIGHIDNKGKFYGEVLCSILYSRRCEYSVPEEYILSYGFSCGERTVGVLRSFSGKVEYYSLISPGIKLNNEFEYKKELYLMRSGLIKKTMAYECLDIRVPDNWKEIFKKELEEYGK